MREKSSKQLSPREREPKTQTLNSVVWALRHQCPANSACVFFISSKLCGSQSYACACSTGNRSRMKIALVVAPFIAVPPADYGGTELFVAHLAEELQRAGTEVIVYANGESKVNVE